VTEQAPATTDDREARARVWELRVWELRDRMRRRRPVERPKVELVPDDAPDPEEEWWQR
jgi:hypothetical protein